MSAAGMSLSGARGPRVVTAAFLLLILSATVLQRFGLNLGSYSLNAALVAVFALLVAAGLCGVLAVSTERLILYGLGLSVALVSAMLNERATSTSSLALLAVMYLPFVFVLTPRAGLTPERAAGLFLDVAALCAVAGVVQFYAQYLIKARWLFDFSDHVPGFLQGPSGYNTVIAVGGLNKSNGFFFREPSGFSFVMALGLMLECLGPRRWWRLGFLGLGLLLSYSGTGLLALLIGLVIPMNRRTLLRLTLAGAVGAGLYALLSGPLNLSYTLSRLDEFGSEESSAYIRYIAPGRLLIEAAASSPGTLWFGHGPGTIFRQDVGYEFHDPTWAKLIFEYGLLGFGTFVALFVVALHRAQPPLRARAMLFGGWLLMGGHLLSPEQNFLTLALVGLLPAAVPLPAPPRAPVLRPRTVALLTVRSEART